jgi:hypothetical protein
VGFNQRTKMSGVSGLCHPHPALPHKGGGGRHGVGNIHRIRAGDASNSGLAIRLNMPLPLMCDWSIGPGLRTGLAPDERGAAGFET